MWGEALRRGHFDVVSLASGCVVIVTGGLPTRSWRSSLTGKLDHIRFDRTHLTGPLLVRGSCLDSISQGLQRFGGGAVPQRAMRPFMVVVVPPALDQDLSFV